MNSRNLSIILGLLLTAAVIVAVFFIVKTDALQQEVQTKDQAIADNATQQNGLLGTIKNLEDAASKKDENIASLRQKVESLQAGLQKAPAETELAAKEKELTRLKTEINDRQSEKENLMAAGKADQARVKDLETRLAEIQKELDRAHSEKQAVAKELAAKNAELVRLTTEPPSQADDARLNELQNETHRLEKDNIALQKEIAEKEAAMKSFREKVGKLESLAASLESEGQKDQSRIEELQGSLLNLKTELGQTQSEKEQVQASLANMKDTYDSLVADLKTQIENKEVTIEQFKEKLTVNLVDRILFDSGQATITRQGRETLAKLGEVLKKVEDKRIRIIGHTDNLPIGQRLRIIYPTNWELSSARAVAVARYFIDRSGLDPRMLEPTGRSYFDPVESNDTPAGRSRNRRVEIIISPVLDE